MTLSQIWRKKPSNSTIHPAPYLGKIWSLPSQNWLDLVLMARRPRLKSCDREDRYEVNYYWTIFPPRTYIERTIHLFISKIELSNQEKMGCDYFTMGKSLKKNAVHLLNKSHKSRINPINPLNPINPIIPK